MSGLGTSPGGGQPIPVFLLGESQGQRSLAGYSPQGHKELEMTEQLSTVHGGNHIAIYKCIKSTFCKCKLTQFSILFF